VLVVVALVVLVNSLDSIIKKGVETVGPKATQVEVRLDGVHLSMLGGHGTLNGLFVGNPSGYKSESAMKVGTAHLALVPSSLMSDKVVIRSLRIESPEITFEGGLKDNNLTQIQKNVQAFAGMTEAAPVGEPAAEPGATKKLQVDEFVLSGAKVNVLITSPVSFTTSVKIADIRLENLGAGPEGITSAELTNLVTDKLVELVTKAAADALADPSKLGKDALQRAGDSLNKSLKNLINVERK
jgi:hypothetical protein